MTSKPDDRFSRLRAMRTKLRRQLSSSSAKSRRPGSPQLFPAGNSTAATTPTDPPPPPQQQLPLPSPSTPCSFVSSTRAAAVSPSQPSLPQTLPDSPRLRNPDEQLQDSANLNPPSPCLATGTPEPLSTLNRKSAVVGRAPDGSADSLGLSITTDQIPRRGRSAERRESEDIPCSPTDSSSPPFPAQSSERNLPGNRIETVASRPSFASYRLPSFEREKVVPSRSTSQREATALTAVDEIPQAHSSPFHPVVGPPINRTYSIPSRASSTLRRQSLLPLSDQRVVTALLDPQLTDRDENSYTPPSLTKEMVHRKIWVKRAMSSPTRVLVSEDDLVDDLRESVLKKYANSLGRSVDAPDILIKVVPTDSSRLQGEQERYLSSQEPVGGTIDGYYPEGQTIDDALIVEIPQRRTPKPSPRHVTYYHPEDLRPGDGGEYFPPMNIVQASSASAVSASSTTGHVSHHPPVHSMSVLTTGQVPPVPSPGNRGSWHQHQHQHRPKYPRQHTTSPTIVSSSPNPTSESPNPSINGVATAPSPPASSTPPVPPPEPPQNSVHTPPAARTSSPRPSQKPRRSKKNLTTTVAEKESHETPLPPSLLDGTIPPINVLIVEDNIINLKLLEAFMKRLKVRWQTAMNGRDAVNKWRAGGFHLVLMDIQLPVMNGLEATKEIRRLERVNHISVFSKNGSGSPSATEVRESPLAASPESRVNQRPLGQPKPEDTLQNLWMFKSPVIIVALTASSLQSDRNEALAAGCNDFLTKPVNIVWLEQKVTEWGCMQALIDFEGWRKWRGFADGPAGPSTGSSPVLTPSTSGASNVESPFPSTVAQTSSGSSGGGVGNSRESSSSTGDRERGSSPAPGGLARSGVGSPVYGSSAAGKDSPSSTLTIVPVNGLGTPVPSSGRRGSTTTTTAASPVEGPAAASGGGGGGGRRGNRGNSGTPSSPRISPRILRS
ncbi:hypothetical protein AJ80_08246 [Polytolypa hystricis UAMH7299]|uniref:Response regulatory domain-containing protein n=1 Tax=Polytolypa hystricis (strain UAMH7299) TaxID=1447883 RepID=A0A2B7X2R0_POLH7|nr:hypothetical protein AJ80_08246 [Polytolypa hystricis UAMH7299]